MIELKNICCGYDRQYPVFNNKSFQFQTNKITFILGANGRGKTTLLKCLTNQLKLFSGQITINGRDLKNMTTKELSRIISYVPQSLDKGIDYNVLDFIAFGRTPYLEPFQSPSDEDYKIALKMIEQNNISHLCKRQVNSISGGERQLVYITRALVQQTPYIIMDEPMSALDFSNQAMILEITARLAQDNKTIILTSHNPNHALSVDSQVCLIDKDKNIIQGKADEILRVQNNITNTFGEQVVFINDNDKGYISFNI